MEAEFSTALLVERLPQSVEAGFAPDKLQSLSILLDCAIVLPKAQCLIGRIHGFEVKVLIPLDPRFQFDSVGGFARQLGIEFIDRPIAFLLGDSAGLRGARRCDQAVDVLARLDSSR